ncbi:27 kDa antigen Cfp30B, partial [uncultured Rubrobacteraceae bacterium]
GQEGVLRAGDVLLGGSFDPRFGGREGLLRRAVRLGVQGRRDPWRRRLHDVPQSGRRGGRYGSARRTTRALEQLRQRRECGRDRRKGEATRRQNVRGALRCDGLGPHGRASRSRRRDALRVGATGAHRRGKGQRRRLHGLERAPDPRPRGGGRLLQRALRLGDRTHRARWDAGLHHVQERRFPERRFHAGDGAARRRSFLLASLLHGRFVRRCYGEGKSARWCAVCRALGSSCRKDRRPWRSPGRRFRHLRGPDRRI